MRANRYVSYLAAEIEPKALANLKRFEDATESTFDRIERFSARAQGNLTGGVINPRAVRDAASAQRALRSVEQQSNATGNAVRKLNRETSLMGVGFTRAGQALNVVQGPLGPLAGRLSALGDAFRTLAGVSLAGVLGGGGAFAVGSIASQYQNVTDRLRPFYDNQTKLNEAMGDIIGIAGRTKSALDPVAELYNRITQAARDAGVAQDKVGRITETVAKAARLSGGARATQEAGITQFAQGFGTNLAGEELRSIRENTPRLARAIAEGLGVSTSKLKELGSQGVLTADLIAKALERSAAQIDAEFARLPPRIGSSLTQAANNVTVFLGRIDEATGATTGLARAIGLVGDNIETVVALGGALVVAMNARSLVDQFRTVERVVDGVTTVQVGAVAAARNYVSTQMERNRREREWAAAINSANTPLYDTAAAVQTIARNNLERAKSEVQASNAAVDGSRAAQAQLRRQLDLIEQQQRANRRARSSAETLYAASRSSGFGGDPVRAAQNLKEANEQVARTTAARIRTEQALAAVDAELAANQNRAAAAAGNLTGAQTRLASAMTVANTQVTVLSRGMAALNVVKGATLRAASSLVAFLGGPWGVALTVATATIGLLATRTSEAKAAADSFAGGQEALNKRLGITTQSLQTQAAAARDLAEALAEAGVQEAKKKARAAGSDLGSSLRDAAFFVPGFFDKKAFNDRKRLVEMADRASAGQFNFEKDFPVIRDMQKRYPTAFKSNFLSSLIGSDPADTAKKVRGAAAALYELEDAEKALAETRKSAGAKPPAPLIIPQAKTRAQLMAAADAMAKGDNAVALARENLRKVTADADAELKQGLIGQDEWIEKVGAAKQAVNDATAAEKAAADARRAGAKANRDAEKAAREQEAALKREAAAAETAADKLAQLQNVLGEFEDQPSGVRRGERAKRRLADFVGERVGDGIYSRDDFERDSQRIDEGVRRPITEALREGERMIAVQREILAGREIEAQLLETAFRWVDQVGEIRDEDLEMLREQLTTQKALNDQMEEQNRLIDIYAQSWADVRDIGRDFIRGLMDNPVDALKDLPGQLLAAFKDAWADEISLKLFGDPEKRFRDEMTRTLNNSGERLTTAADVLRMAGRDLRDAASAIAAGGTGTAEPGDVVSGFGQFPAAAGGPAGALAPVVQSVTSGVKAAIGGNVVGGFAGFLRGITSAVKGPDGTGTTSASNDNEIIVTAQRIARKERTSALPNSMRDNWNQIGKDLGTQIFGANSPITRVMGKLGTAMEGATYGMASSGIARSIGLKQSNTGAAIGGAIGNFIPGLPPGVGAAIGGLVGGTIGGALKSAKRGSATITSIEGDISTRGNSGAFKQAASGAASGVQDALSRVAEALGGDVGSFAVSIGMRDGKWRVDPTGKGVTKTKKGAIDFGKDGEDEAIRYAILNAIQDGAVKGIREGAQRLLQAGKDLDRQLQKAVQFNNVFRRLKQYTDPVGAAVDDVNTEFSNLIAIFKEAGASAAEMADLEKLYGFERAKAIEEATSRASSALQDFINGNLRGSDSPLSRRTVYENAQKALEQGRADFASGKIGGDALVQILTDLQNASRTLNGSRGTFFQDFDMLMALAQEAAKAQPGVPGSTSPLPGSPFDPIAANTAASATLLQDQNVILEEGFKAMVAALGRGGIAPGSGGSLDLLPGNIREARTRLSY